MSWAGVQPENPGVENALNDAAIASSCRAWAVGVYLPSTTGSEQAMIERWNGATWRRHGVAATSATSAWAVGDYQNGNGTAEQTLILRWNGRSWKKVPSPSPGPLGNFLGGVRGAGAVLADVKTRRPSS